MHLSFLGRHVSIVSILQTAPLLSALRAFVLLLTHLLRILDFPEYLSWVTMYSLGRLPVG